MARRRAEKAPLGFTSNGVVVVNALTFLAPREAERLRRALPKDGDWFVAAAVPQTELGQVLTRLDDAAAEAAARLAAAALASSKPRKPRKPRK